MAIIRYRDTERQTCEFFVTGAGIKFPGRYQGARRGIQIASRLLRGFWAVYFWPRFHYQCRNDRRWGFENC